MKEKKRENKFSENRYWNKVILNNEWLKQASVAIKNAKSSKF